MASPNLNIVPLLRHKTRVLRQLPRIRQILPVHSRASCFWSHQCKASSRVLPWIHSGGVQRRDTKWRSSFSTSTIRLFDPDNANKQASRPASPSEKEQQAPKPLPLTASLKAKLPLVRVHEQIYNIPNLLTFSRLLSTPILGYLILHNHPLYAFTLFVYAGTSDLLDGWIARRWKLQTVVGSVVDPMADKVLMTTLVTCLAVNGSLSLPLATLILGRDASLAVAALYFRYASLPAPKTTARYWDFSLPSAEVHPTTISKLNTFLQLILIGTTMCVSLLHDPTAISSATNILSAPLLSVQDALGGPEGVVMLVKGMSAVVAGTTVYSGLSYAWMKDAVKILGDDEALKKKQGARGRMIIGSTFGSVIVIAAWLLWREMQDKTETEEEKEK
ncbi:hypothetical protein P280DRAFT_470979 [Massarina eburnea CBS 473.64]|uniref:Cardiolipin synthetase n=1 Tax=Massarina eburnea CBS 473.64 TaxID=1395130 RepID=A0A6A6RUI3_9PLEO|nr:hypothetical protein P280DRAFT_470979 [Massarina eburnea CBS 473.64]